MKVLVCGGRDYSDYAAVCKALDRWAITTLAQGGARGADLLSRKWALERGVPFIQFDANWALHGKRAGPIRNAQMLATFKPEMVIAFTGGRGTAHMREIAFLAGVPVMDYL